MYGITEVRGEYENEKLSTGEQIANAIAKASVD